MAKTLKQTRWRSLIVETNQEEDQTMKQISLSCSFIIFFLALGGLTQMAWATDTCEPVWPPEVKTQGYWNHQCKALGLIGKSKGKVRLHEEWMRDMDDLEEVCGKIDADPSDMCSKALKQTWAMRLNMRSDKIAKCNCLYDGSTVDDAWDELGAMIRHGECKEAMKLADGINTGELLVECPDDTTCPCWTAQSIVETIVNAEVPIDEIYCEDDGDYVVFHGGDFTWEGASGDDAGFEDCSLCSMCDRDPTLDMDTVEMTPAEHDKYTDCRSQIHDAAAELGIICDD
jgi:hypothetical protein